MKLLREHHDWSPAVCYAQSLVACTPQIAWEYALRYEIWNPGLREARITRVSGRARDEGELVLIHTYEAGVALPAFYARTVRLVPLQHVVWLVYPEVGDGYCNFLDFGFVQLPTRLQFNVCYYTHYGLSADAATEQRGANQFAMDTLASAFKEYCEANSQPPDPG